LLLIEVFQGYVVSTTGVKQVLAVSVILISSFFAALLFRPKRGSSV